MGEVRKELSEAKSVTAPPVKLKWGF